MNKIFHPIKFQKNKILIFKKLFYNNKKSNIRGINEEEDYNNQDEKNNINEYKYFIKKKKKIEKESNRNECEHEEHKIPTFTFKEFVLQKKNLNYILNIITQLDHNNFKKIQK
jgi:hypothetical protein